MIGMFNIIRAAASKSYVRYTLATWETLKTALATIGALWVMVEIADFFSDPAGAVLRASWRGLAEIALVAIVYQRRPVTVIKHRLGGRDIHIAIQVGDLFRVPGACVIPTNTTFDTDLSFISLTSIQGQFTSRYYGSDVSYLDDDIGRALGGVEPIELLQGNRAGKTARYAIGTTALIKLNKKGRPQRAFYLLASAELNEVGTCRSVTFDQIKTALAELWDYVSRHGNHEPLVVGLIGTGHGRTTATREEVARETITSFVAACASSSFCNDFTLVIHPADLARYSINLYELGDYLRHVCQYTNWSGGGIGVGTPVAP